jgi:hypothetical protein
MTTEVASNKDQTRVGGRQSCRSTRYSSAVQAEHTVSPVPGHTVVKQQQDQDHMVPAMLLVSTEVLLVEKAMRVQRRAKVRMWGREYRRKPGAIGMEYREVDGIEVGWGEG